MFLLIIWDNFHTAIEKVKLGILFIRVSCVSVFLAWLLTTLISQTLHLRI